MIEIIAKVENINQGLNFSNISVIDIDKQVLGLKLEPEVLEKIQVGKVYRIYYEAITNELKPYNKLIKIDAAEEVLDSVTLSEVLDKFYIYAPLKMEVMKEEIEKYLGNINNKYIKLIVSSLYEKYKNNFYIHPAATKFHHAFVGGLAYHTLSILRLVEPFLKVYPYLNSDLIYGGIIIHDICKIDEMTGVDGEYTNEGLLIGHIVMVTNEIDKIASINNIGDKEEVMLLKHIALSHHGIPNYGSPKKPQIGEALLIWYLDTIDSKLHPLGDALEDTASGKFTNMISALDKQRFYKANIKDE